MHLKWACGSANCTLNTETSGKCFLILIRIKKWGKFFYKDFCLHYSFTFEIPAISLRKDQFSLYCSNWKFIIIYITTKIAEKGLWLMGWIPKLKWVIPEKLGMDTWSTRLIMNYAEKTSRNLDAGKQTEAFIMDIFKEHMTKETVYQCWIFSSRQLTATGSWWRYANS